MTFDEKKALVAAEENKIREERLKKFVDEHNELCKKYGCGFVARTIIEGSKIQSVLVPVFIK